MNANTSAAAPSEADAQLQRDLTEYEAELAALRLAGVNPAHFHEWRDRRRLLAALKRIDDRLAGLAAAVKYISQSQRFRN